MLDLVGDRHGALVRVSLRRMRAWASRLGESDLTKLLAHDEADRETLLVGVCRRHYIDAQQDLDLSDRIDISRAVARELLAEGALEALRSTCDLRSASEGW